MEKFRDYVEKSLGITHKDYVRQRLLLGRALGNDKQGRSMKQGTDIQESVRQKMEEEEAKRRQNAVGEHVPPPKGVSLQDQEALAAEEKATRMFPAMAEEARRTLGLAPYAAQPRGRSLDWWNK
jgi:hypothetical protein